MNKTVIAIFNAFSGPIGALAEKGILSGLMYAAGRGWIGGDITGLAATLYAALSASFTSVVATQTAKAQDIVQTQGNGITVVKKADAVDAGIKSVTAPQ